MPSVFGFTSGGEIYKKGCAQRHTPFYYRSIFLFLGSAKLGCHLSEMVGLGTHAHGHCHATFGFLGGSFGSFLFELGHKNIAVLSSTSVRSTTSRATRVAGVLSEVRKVLSEDHLLILSGNSGSTDMLQEKSSHYQMGHTLAQNKKIFQRNITGLICVNDLVAYGAMDALISRGYRIPEDFSVIGSDNLLFSSMPQVSLTTIEHHPYIVAQSALTTLLNRTHMSVTNQSASSTARFQVQCQPNLIIRHSTGPARTGMLPGMPGPRF